MARACMRAGVNNSILSDRGSGTSVVVVRRRGWSPPAPFVQYTTVGADELSFGTSLPCWLSPSAPPLASTPPALPASATTSAISADGSSTATAAAAASGPNRKRMEGPLTAVPTTAPAGASSMSRWCGGNDAPKEYKSSCLSSPPSSLPSLSWSGDVGRTGAGLAGAGVSTVGFSYNGNIQVACVCACVCTI